MFLRSKILNKNSTTIYRNVRTFLSEQFKCPNEWNSRLQPTFMQNTNLENLYYEIKQASSQKNGKLNAIDIDIFVNKTSAADESRVDEINELIHTLRISEETTNTLDSTHHAVVRNYVDMGHITDLISILDNRMAYGIFLDDYSASYLLDYLIKKQDFHSAARTATFLMLQEDFENELPRSLALFACYKYLNRREPFYQVEEKDEQAEKPKEVKVRVKFLRNEFFDDHFDIKNHDHLVGKTFVAIGKKLDKPFSPNVKLLGYTLYGKYEEALKELKTTEKIFFKETLEHCLKVLEAIEVEDPSLESLKVVVQERLANTNQLQSESFDTLLEDYCKSVVAKQEPVAIEAQKELYKKWNNLREEKLTEELNRLQRAKRLKKIELMTEEMKKKEQHLWFFENESDIDLQIDSKKAFYPKRWFGKKKVPRVIDADYVPPEIIKSRQ
ncbi:28S ribosomal protein S27, mitochondrial [Episyrphus balteatus]|uniref:28S ribosomal protein S27, mitochondrial n=1 Tax=Episyrphus balteatus TaxID=286459 RepID=UPI002485F915|nr:28S ribosomal protein S27, mitochondrial [Episyrphus balteatus]